MLIFIKGNNELLNLFIECMAAGQEDSAILNYSDSTSYYRNLEKLDPLIDSNSAVICFNSIGLVTISPYSSCHENISISQNTDLYWNKKKVTIYNIFVDHPLFFTESLQSAPLFPKLQFICIDKHQVILIRSMLPALSHRFHFVPHGGINTVDLHTTASYGGYAPSLHTTPTPKFGNMKSTDIVYLGAGDTGDVTYPPIGISGINDSDFYEYAFNELINNPYVQEDTIVDAYATANGLGLSTGEKLTLTAILLKTVHFDAMRVSKIKLLSALANEGLHITVHGKGWTELANKYPSLITEGKYLHPAECPAVMEQAHFSLNFQPFFSDGAHERVFGAMRCGSICVSNRSRYLESRFRDKEDILYYDFYNLNETALYIKELLSDNSRMQHIIENAKAKVQNDSWNDRLQALLAV